MAKTDMIDDLKLIIHLHTLGILVEDISQFLIAQADDKRGLSRLTIANYIAAAPTQSESRTPSMLLRRPEDVDADADADVDGYLF